MRHKINQRLENISNECAQQTQMDQAVLKNVLVEERMPEKTETYLKFLECSYKKQHYVDDNNLISYSTIENFLKQFIDSGDLRTVMAPCEKLQEGASVGEKAFNAGNCILTQLKELEARTKNESSESTESSEEQNKV